MAKQMMFDNAARSELKDGLEKLSSAVKVTLGPTGRNVILHKSWGSPKVTKDGVEDLVPPSRSIRINKGQDVINLMRIECIGSNLRLFVNGHLLAEVQDDSHSSGTIGLAVTAWTEQDGKQFSEVAFDNLVMTAP